VPTLTIELPQMWRARAGRCSALTESQQGQFVSVSEWVHKVPAGAGADFNRNVAAHMVLPTAQYQSKQLSEPRISLSQRYRG